MERRNLGRFQTELEFHGKPGSYYYQYSVCITDRRFSLQTQPILWKNESNYEANRRLILYAVMSIDLLFLTETTFIRFKILYRYMFWLMYYQIACELIWKFYSKLLSWSFTTSASSWYLVASSSFWKHVCNTDRRYTPILRDNVNP